jgi:hypothetical protein
MTKNVENVKIYWFLKFYINFIFCIHFIAFIKIVILLFFNAMVFSRVPVPVLVPVHWCCLVHIFRAAPAPVLELVQFNFYFTPVQRCWCSFEINSTGAGAKSSNRHRTAPAPTKLKFFETQYLSSV